MRRKAMSKLRPYTAVRVFHSTSLLHCAAILSSHHCVRDLPHNAFRLLLLSLLSAVGAAATAAERPNVVFIVADDLGYGELGCYGGKEIPTPQIDSIARHGVRFTNAYVTAPFCAASRAAILTGRYQTRFGFENNPIGAANADPAIGLPLTEATLPEVLRNAGYATGLIGKWHLGGAPKFNPQRRGFDTFFGF